MSHNRQKNRQSCPTVPEKAELLKVFDESPYGPVTGEGAEGGKGVLKTGVEVDELVLLRARLTFGQISKLEVKVRNTLLALVTPRLSSSVLLAPEPPSIHLKLYLRADESQVVNRYRKPIVPWKVLKLTSSVSKREKFTPEVTASFSVIRIRKSVKTDVVSDTPATP